MIAVTSLAKEVSEVLLAASDALAGYEAGVGAREWCREVKLKPV